MSYHTSSRPLFGLVCLFAIFALLTGLPLVQPALASPPPAAVEIRPGVWLAASDFRSLGDFGSLGAVEPELTAGRRHTCGLKADGGIACWGNDEYGQVSGAPTSGSFVSVGAGGYHTCAIKDDGNAICWGWNEYGQAPATPPAGPFTQVTAGFGHTCALQVGGGVACWGWNEEGQRYPPLGLFDQISAGNEHNCGLRPDGSAACWGANEYGQAPSTPPSGPFTQISAGDFHNCALKSDGTAVCWGRNTHGQAPATPPAGPFVQMAGGYLHTCGLKDDGSVDCWGYNELGESVSQAGPFDRIAAGSHHNCGLHPDSTMDCWGYNDDSDAPRLLISPSILLDALAGRQYDDNVNASGGTEPITFTTAAGGLPPGITLAADGAVSGMATATGAFTFTVQATDSHPGFQLGRQKQYSLKVTCGYFWIEPSSLDDATMHTFYSQTLSTVQNENPMTYTLSSGVLPDGLTLTEAGILSGTPTRLGSFDFSLRATDIAGCRSALASYTWEIVCPTIAVSPATLPAAANGAPYAATITSTGGAGVVTYTVTSGALPAGLTLSPAGELSGTPTEAGTFDVTVTATDEDGCTGSEDYSLEVACAAITVSPHLLPAVTYGAAYAQTITATGGAGTMTYTLSSGTLPAGLTLSPAGELAGSTNRDGSYAITITATDEKGCTGERAYTLVVSPPALRLQKLAERDTVPAGWVVRYTIKVKNQSAGAVPLITVTDALPAGVVFVSADPAGYTRSGRNVVWKLRNVPAGATRTLHLSVRTYSTFRGVIDNLARAVAGGFSTSVRKLVRIVAP